MAARIDGMWLKDRFRDHHLDALRLELDQDEYDIEGELLGSGTVDLRKLPNRDSRRIARLLQQIYSTVILNQVTFAPAGRMNAWAREAFEFYRLNVGNSEFVHLFSIGLHYDVILQSLIRIDSTTTRMRAAVAEYTEGNLDTVFTPTFSRALIDTTTSVAEAAIRPALGSLARELQEMEHRPPKRSRASIPLVQDIELSSSYQNKRGLINFITVGDRLALPPRGTKAAGPDYRVMLDRAIARLQVSRTMDRIANYDPILRSLVREYIAVYKKPLDGDAALILFAIGQEIDARIIYNQKQAPDDERIDADALAFLIPFMTAHGLFVQGLDVVRQATEDIDDVNESFARLSPGAKPIPGSLLRTLAETESLFTASTQEAIKKLSNAVNENQAAPTRGLNVVSLGTLRGSVRAMAGHIMEKIYQIPLESTTGAAKDLLKEAIKATLKNPGLQQHVSNFFTVNSVKLAELAHQMPHYFSWVRSFLTLIS